MADRHLVTKGFITMRLSHFSIVIVTFDQSFMSLLGQSLRDVSPGGGSQILIRTSYGRFKYLFTRVWYSRTGFVRTRLTW